RRAGYQKLTRLERQAAARKAARSRRWFKAPVPTIKGKSDMAEASSVLPLHHSGNRPQDPSPRPTNKSEPARAFRDQVEELMELIDSIPDTDLEILASALSGQFPAE